MRRIVALTLLLLLAPAAAAQESSVVARDGGVELRAYHDRGLCLETTEGTSCGDAPDSPFDAVTIEDEGSAYGVAVVPAVTRVEIELRNGARRSAPTAAAPGFRARFALFARPGRVALARFYAADGALVGAVEEHLRPAARPAVVRSFRDGAVVRVRQTASLEPSVTDPDRVVTFTCVGIAGASKSCTDNPRSLVVATCEGARKTVYALLPASADQVVLDLGNGETVTAAAVRLPGAAAFAAQVASRLAVRRVRVRDAAGGSLVTARLGFAPCSAKDRTDNRDLPPRLNARPVPVASAGGHALVVASADGRLCAGIDRIRQPCIPPPYYDRDGFLLWRRGETVGGIVDTATAVVRVRRRGGAKVEVPAVADARFPGVRFFVTLRPAGSGPVIATALRDDGRRLGSGFEVSQRIQRLGTVVQHRGRRLVRVRAGTPFGDFRCVGSLAMLGANGFCRESDPRTSASVEVGCAPHRQAMVFGRGPGIRVVLDSGRRLPMRRVALGGRAGFPPPGAGIRSVTVGDRTVRVDLPAATEQCGYGAQVISD